MALQKINWTQIETVPPSGSTVVLGSEYSPLEGIFTNDLNVSGGLTINTLQTLSDVVVGGSLTVLGTTTTINSTTISLGDNIIELNGTAEALGGLLVRDPTSPNLVSGSLLWDSANDRWIAGPSGSERPILIGGLGNTNVLQKVHADGTLVDSRVSDDGNTITISGATIIKGDLIVEGKTTLIQKNDPNADSLVVSGAMSIVQNMINTQVVSASLNIQGLGVFSSPTANAEIDLGGFF
jgi:uncharacterized Zn-binding protein involved in type VI secretion